MIGIASSVLLITGSALLLLAALGVLRMPDLYMRMSASSKAVTLGAGLIALGLAVHVEDGAVTTRALLIVVIFFLKAPVSAHMLGRAAYMSGVPLWHATIVDEMRDIEGITREPQHVEPEAHPEAEQDPSATDARL
jgi:multicomponent Na+:H+ antiporter subunit G